MNLLIFDEFGHLSHLCPSHFKIPPFIRVERGGGIFALLLHVLLIVKTLRLFVLWWWWWGGLNIFLLLLCFYNHAVSVFPMSTKNLYKLLFFIFAIFYLFILLVFTLQNFSFHLPIYLQFTSFVDKAFIPIAF